LGFPYLDRSTARAAKVRGVSRVGSVDQPPIKSALVCAGFVAGYEQDGLPHRIEGKGNSPNSILRVEPHLFHVAEPRSFQRIYMRAPQARSVGFEHPSNRQ
jgi:hypothetical protein